jgi:cell division protein FtsB
MGIRILIPRPRLRARSGRTQKFVWAALGVALWGTAYTFFGAGGLVGVYRARAEIERLETRVEEAQTVNAGIAARIQALESDPEEIERVAREELYLTRPGDKVYLLDAAPEPADSEADPSTSPETDASRH